MPDIFDFAGIIALPNKILFILLNFNPYRAYRLCRRPFKNRKWEGLW